MSQDNQPIDINDIFKQPKNEDDMVKFNKLLKYISESAYPNCFYWIFCCYSNPRSIFNEYSQSPYHTQSSYQVIQALLDNNIPNYTCVDIYGKTCLHYPKDYKSYEVILSYFSWYFMLNTLDNDGNSYFFQQIDVDIAKLLVKNNVNYLTINNKGETCFSVQENEDTKKYLMDIYTNYFIEKYEEFLLVEKINRHERYYNISLTLRNPNYNDNNNNNLPKHKYVKFDEIILKENFFYYLKLYKILITKKNKSINDDKNDNHVNLTLFSTL